MFCFVSVSQPPLSGGYCVGVPPLPIPNREVKPVCADGTAMQCGRVGSRLFYMEPPESWCFPEAFFIVSCHDSWEEDSWVDIIKKQ